MISLEKKAPQPASTILNAAKNTSISQKGISIVSLYLVACTLSNIEIFKNIHIIAVNK